MGFELFFARGGEFAHKKKCPGNSPIKKKCPGVLQFIRVKVLQFIRVNFTQCKRDIKRDNEDNALGWSGLELTDTYKIRQALLLFVQGIKCGQ